MGLSEELTLARLMATWNVVVAEHLPGASGGSRVAALDGRTLVIEADHPLIGQEIRLREPDLVSALRATPGRPVVDRLRIRIGRTGDTHL
jgi:hypothetical protein